MRIPNDNPAEFLGRIVPFVYADGARNFNAVCRELSIPYQTLRFRMSRFREQGISVIPVVDIERIGLQRIRAWFELSSDIQNPKAFLGGLHQKAGLKYYSRSLMSQTLDCEFLIPKEGILEFGKLLGALQEMRLITNAEFKPLLWREVLMMKAAYFDYQSGEWDIDFSRLTGDPSIMVPKHFTEEIKFDHSDLLIIKSLELEPWIKVVDLAEKVGLAVGDVSYHLNRHVFGKKMIPSFRLRWIGTKEAWSKHKIIIQTFTFDKLSDDLARHAMSIMTATPFCWDHMRDEDGTYSARLLIPVTHFPETQSYISEQIRPLGLKPKADCMDWSLTSTFTIPYTMFEQGKGWELEAEAALGYVLQMISQYGKL